MWKKEKINGPLYYSIMVLLNILPFIPLSIKGIIGLFFVIFSCVKISYRQGLLTSTILIGFSAINFILDINVDYKYPVISLIMGTFLYYFSSYLIGNIFNSFNCKNYDLFVEIKLRKNIEKELQEKLGVLQSLMDTIPSPIFFKDLNLKYIGSNKAFEDNIAHDISGKTTFDISDKEYASLYNNKDEELLEDWRKIQVYEGKIKFKDGSIRDVIFNKAVYVDSVGYPIGIVGIITDITYKRERDELKETVVEKEGMIQEILEIDKLKTAFLSNISHELRTPLNVILGANCLMERYSKENKYTISDEKIIKNIQVTKQNCFRLLRLVNNLIDINRVDASAFEINLRNLNIVNIVEEITLSVAKYFEYKGKKVTFDTEVEEVIIACDQDKIERIILNLLSNAIKFTQEKGYIFVTMHRTKDSVFIKVIDNGVGIPAEKQGEVFKRFYQVEDLFCRKNEGSGIGLNLVKSLVEMHGGEITLQSELGVGSIFTIQLPIRKVDESNIENKNYGPDNDFMERINIEFSDIYMD